MKRLLKPGLCCAALLLAAGLSGCSTVSSVAEKSGAMLSHLNPFSSSPAEAEQQPEPANTTQAQATPAPDAQPVLQVAAAPAPVPQPPQPAAPKPVEVKAVVGDNAQCTTFCALPLRKPQ